jgi:hypothetical protein
VFFDTPGWALHRQGYSYRFRTRLRGGGGPKYSVRLERERRFGAAGEPKLDLSADLSEEVGAAIEAGAPERAVLEPGASPAERLREVLRELALEPAALGPRLVAELERERIDVSDKGQDWFELDHEQWSFRLLDRGIDAPAVSFEDVVIDTRLGRQDPELLRRVRTMRELVEMVPGLRPQGRAPHERAIESLEPPVVGSR